MKIKLIKRWIQTLPAEPGDVVDVADDLGQSAIERGIAEPIERKVVKVVDIPKTSKKRRGGSRGRT